MNYNKPIAVTLLSGGMDSVTLLYLLLAEGYKPIAVSFDYGQRHSVELELAKHHADYLDVEHKVVDITSVKALMQGSALTDDIEVPHGHYAADNMKATVVPNRNMIMLAIAGALAVSKQAVCVAAAMHAGDHPIYPDCRPTFTKAFDKALRQGTLGYSHKDLHLYTPFVNKSKAQIVSLGQMLNIDYAKTWSCYEGMTIHCGACGTCVERREAFYLANVFDPTTYDIETIDFTQLGD